MDLGFRASFQREPFKDDPKSANTDFIPSRGPTLQTAENMSKLQNTQPGLRQNGNNSRARQELQRLYKSFHLWLQPEKHSKDEIIFQLALEQFMINKHYSEKSTLKEKWEASGGDLEKFTEDLHDDCIKLPDLVHVRMQGQEALFSENMPLKEVIFHLTNQLSTGGVNMGTPSWTVQDMSLETGQRNEDIENDGNISVKTHQVNDSITSLSNQIPSLIIVQEENHRRLEEGGVSLENPRSSRRGAGPGPSRPQDGSLKGPSSQDVLMGVEPDQVTPEPVSTHRSSEGTSARGEHQERSHRAPEAYRCERCPKTFRHSSRFRVHQKRHNNERTYICAECGKGFFQASDLHAHQRIHTGEKPFVCSTCEMAFTHRTNLRAHERTHTGEKPYECSLCQRRFRQSSTYHRHLRFHQKTTLKSAPP
ncbi:zinc finger and SCAN domain-containing protein 4 [Oryx dammah]|uniref:zinc finger and SCAN domain-containing protein 4 n=1 Tax=Oryx dammah TaxID=59534 RepID=UPI001A9A7733|nr:zinc finger and SCAN domain-containing protein 4 [Oryx dammah]